MKVIELARQLIQEPSISPSDANCQEIIAKLLSDQGFKIIYNNINQTKNLLAIKGSVGPTIVMLGHTDIVPPGPNWSTEPFKPCVIDGKLYGRGAVDMKAAVAAMIHAACDIKINHGKVAIMLTSDEEGSGQDGIHRVLPDWHRELGKIDACIVGEPTSEKIFGDKIKLGRRGSINGELCILGTQGHAAYPELAKNPIMIATKAINLLARASWEDNPGLFPKTKFVCTGIQSGDQACNVIPGEVKLKFNLRYSPATTPEKIKEKIAYILEKNHIEFVWKSWKVSLGGPYKSAAKDLTAALVDSIKVHADIVPEISYDGGTSDGRFLAKFCDEVVEFGALRQTAHKVDEHIELEHIEKLYRIYLNTLSVFFADQPELGRMDLAI